MRKHMKRIVGTVMAVIIFLSDIPIVVKAEEDEPSASQAVELIDEMSESMPEDVETEEAEIISELTEKRDETTKYFEMSDGTIKACIYPQNVHYLEDEKYEEIDNTLVETRENDKVYYKNKKNSFSVKMPETISEDYIEFSDENGYVKFKLLGATNKKLEKLTKEKKNKNHNSTDAENINVRSIYKAVKGDIDIEYDINGNKLKETIILYKKTKNSFIFDVQTSAKHAEVNEDNSISFFDEEGKTLYMIASPYMIDDMGDYSTEIKTTLKKSETGYTLTYTPDYEWLSAKERDYPVKIDPTLFQAIHKDTVTDTYVSNVQTASNPDIRGAWDVLNIGKRTSTVSGQQLTMRGLIRFEIPSEIKKNDCIVDAKLDLVHYTDSTAISVNGIQIDAHELTSGFTEGGTWWGNQPSYDSIVTDYALVNRGNTFPGSTLSYDSYNLTRLVNKWHNGDANYGILLKLHNETVTVSSSQQVYYFAKQSTYYGSVSKFVEITYRNAVGLEDYWSYTTQDFGQYGMGYVNNYNGNLVYVHEDVSFNSLINGFTLSHVYNSSLSSDGMGYYGSGWRLNLVQTLEPITVTGNSSVKYVYTDGDGTRHYFIQLSDGSIVDEDGLGYTYENISEGDLSRKLTDKNGTILKFDRWSYLRQIIDSNGNTISLNYSPIPGVDNYLTSIMTSSGGVFALRYDSNYKLSYISDNAGRKTTYYYSQNNLTEIHYPDNTILKLDYNSNVSHWLQRVISPDNMHIQYENYSSSGKISKASFFGTDNTLSSNTSFEYLQNQTKVFDTSNRSLTYQFDNWGRPTCIYDDKKNIYSQTYTSTSVSGNGIFKNNKLSTTCNETTYINNLLINGMFFNDMSSWNIHSENSNSEFSVTSDIGLISSKSIKITNVQNTTSLIAQIPSVGSSQTYTFSAYLKTENVQSDNKGAALEVVVDSPAGKKYYYSDYITGTTSNEIDNGFQHVHTSFTLEEDESIVRVSAGLYESSGNLFINALQLEIGDSANQINLVENSSFEHNSGFSSNPPNGYTVAGSGITNDHSAADGTWSYWIRGEVRQTKSLRLIIPQSGKKGDIYSFGMWVNTQAIPNGHNGSSLRLACGFEAADGTMDWHNIEFNNYVHDWQFASDVNIADWDYTKIKLYMCFDYNANGTYFDSLFLYRDTAHSYTYDDNGNIINSVNYAKQQLHYEYSDNHLSKLINPKGTSYEYVYDSNKNMVLSRSGEGLQYNNEYDSLGNIISTSVSLNSYSTSITADKIYYIRNKLTGKYMDVSGENIQQNHFTGTTSQMWKLISNNDGSFLILNQSNLENGYMTVSNCENKNRQNIHVYRPPNGSSFVLKAESMKIQPATNYTYKILTAASNYSSCVEVADNNTSVGANIHQWSYWGTDAQQWYFEPIDKTNEIQIVDNTVYQFRARNSGKYIDVSGKFTTAGTYLQQCEQNYGLNQRYIAQQYEDTDYFTLTPTHAQNMLLEVSNELGEYGYSYLQLGDHIITERKLFKFEYNEQMKAHYITPKFDETLALDVANYSLENGAKLLFTPKHGETNRFFIAEKISDTIVTSATYQDNGNYPHTITDSRGNTTTYTYDTNRGLKTGITDSKGTTTFAYHALHDRLESVTNGNSTVGYQYETNGALKNITTPSGSVYNFFYDVFGRTSRISIGTQTLNETTYKDADSSLVSRFAYGNGVYKTYEYDNQDRLISESVNGIMAQSYIYDKLGNISKTTDLLTNVTTTYTRDLIGRISSIKSTDGQKTQYVYDGYNRLSLLKWSKGDSSFSYNYIYGDNAVENPKTGLIYGVKQNGIQQFGYAYDELTRLSRRILHTTAPYITEYTYLEGADAHTTTTLVKSLKNGNDLLEYTYDEVGNITTVSKNGTVVEEYAYDALSRLISATYGDDTYVYTYDNGGNLLTIKKNGEVIKTYMYGNSEWTDQLTEYNGDIITYDEIGNPLTYRSGMSFTWQNGRQLATITQNGNIIATYSYNADGLRTSKTINGTTTEYYWQEGTLYGEKTGEESIFYLYDETGRVYGFFTKTEQSSHNTTMNLISKVI